MFDLILSSQDCMPFAISLAQHWSYDLAKRQPGPAVLSAKGIQPTDLDLACLLMTLAERKAMIFLPTYQGVSTARSTTTTVLSATDRRGKLLRVSSNQEFFSFSILVNDLNVVNNATGEVGAPRYFTIIGKDGKKNPGWESLSFVPNAKENEFIEKFGLSVQHNLAFKTFVQPERWSAFFSPYYTMSKVLLQRLEAENKLLRQRMKELQRSQPQSKGAADYSVSSEDKAEKSKLRKVEVPLFESEVIHKKMESDKVSFSLPEGDDTFEDRQQQLKQREELIASLRFSTRVTEYAFYRARGEKAGLPVGIKGQWASAARNWRELEVEDDVTLRYRIRKKTVEIV